MGCNMYAHIEHKLEGRWEYVRGDVYDGRSYPLFAHLAGVRNHEGLTPIAEPRGLPSAADGQYTLEVHKARYEPNMGRDQRITSWFTLAELESVDWIVFFAAYSGGEDWSPVMDLMRGLADGHPDNVRLVFWFDDTIADMERCETHPELTDSP